MQPQKQAHHPGKDRIYTGITDRKPVRSFHRRTGTDTGCSRTAVGTADRFSSGISQGAAGEADNTAQDDSSAGSTHVGKAQTESAFTRPVKQYPLLWIPIGLILLFTVMSAIILIRYFTVRQMRTAKKRKTDIKSMVQEERREMVMEAYRSFEKMLAAGDMAEQAVWSTKRMRAI